jgi:hypothetical protein
LAFAGTALAVAPVVSLRLGGSHPSASAACGGDKDVYAVVKKGSKVTVSGTIKPTPRAGWHVLVEVKQCAGDHFRRIWKRNVVGRPNGSFLAVYAATHPGVFVARATYRTTSAIESRKQRFVVR